MKVSYFGYAFRTAAGQTHVCGLDSLLRSFCHYRNIAFKNQFKCGEERQYLLPNFGNLFLFIQTRSGELIKKIDSQSLSVSEIYEELNQNERIGFASYVYIGDGYIGYASTMMAPKIGAFADFVNKIIGRLGSSTTQFVVEPLFYKTTREDVLRMPFVGKSMIQVSASNNLFREFAELLGGRAEEYADVDSFEVTIKPKRRKNIAQAAKKIIERAESNGLDKMIIMAKENLHGNLMELYLAGNGIVSDQLDLRDEENLAERIQQKIERNTNLRERVQEYVANETVSHTTPDIVSRYSDARSWSIAFDSLPDAA